jgi:LPS sulfotransferase NodH
MTHVSNHPRLCVLLGAPRSGTTWLQRLISSSPHVASPQETSLFHAFLLPQHLRWSRQQKRLDNVLGQLSTRGRAENRVVGLPTILRAEDLVVSQRLLIERLLSRAVAAKPSASLVLEKTPSNSLCVDLINELCPQVLFLHIVRDPRDVMASLRDAADSWGKRWAPSNPAGTARLWLSHYEGARRAAAFTGRYLEVRYEDLRAAPTTVLHQVLDFLCLPDSPAELIERERRSEKAGDASVLVYAPEIAAQLANSPHLEPAGFRSTGRAPLNRSARRTAEVVLGREARAAGYGDSWERMPWPSRTLWRQWTRLEVQLDDAHRLWTRATTAWQSSL